jgi:hypothetical protein
MTAAEFPLKSTSVKALINCTFIFIAIGPLDS